jgi:hypothetical protein
MGTEESRETRQEIDVTLHDGHADVTPFVWAWDGESWDGPEASGDYSVEESQPRRRS